jgi:hypothetical protein
MTVFLQVEETEATPPTIPTQASEILDPEIRRPAEMEIPEAEVAESDLPVETEAAIRRNL